MLVAPNKMLLGEWLEIWLQDYKRPKTFESYEMLVRRHLTPALGHIRLLDLRPEHIQHFMNEKLAAGRVDGTGGLFARTVRYLHVLLYSALEQAEKNQLVLRNVSKLTALPRHTRRDLQPLTKEQVRELLPVVAADRLGAAMLVAIHTGLRRGELLGLCWEDIDFKASVLHVRQAVTRVRLGETSRLLFQEPKTAQSKRTVSLTPTCLDVLKHHKA